MKLSMKTLTAVLFVGLALAPAWADDLYPPPWQRGGPGTTYQQWEFLDNNPTPLPDQMYNPYGTPSTHVYPGVGQSWYPTWGGRDGVWPLSGTIIVDIPNQPLANPMKDIWIQLTWARQVDGSYPYVWETLTNNVATVVNEMPLGPTGVPAPSDTWYHTTFRIHLEPNPSHEIIRIDGTLMVDELVIDTQCVPEPATLGLLALGGLALLRRR